MEVKVETEWSKVDFSKLNGTLGRIQAMDSPDFATHKPDFAGMKRKLSAFGMKKNLILIGNGGSINSTIALHGSLGSKKRLQILCTMEPDEIDRVKDLYPKGETLVMPVSKSGANIGPLEDLMFFLDYPVLPVTSPRGALYEIAKERKWDWIEHPDISGRFAGRSSCSFAPGMFLGLDVEEINSGAMEMYKKCDPDVPINGNPAMQISAALNVLENRGFTDVFCPIYSTKLASFIPLVFQLMHEGACKEGVGQTFYGGLGPETQHHTNQRFFGGRKNSVGLFTRVESFEKDLQVEIPGDLRDVKLGPGRLMDLRGLTLSKSMGFELDGVLDNARKDAIPHMVISVSKVTPRAVGEYLALWQYVGLYSALFNGVNPYDQPAVEYSKNVSLKLRMKKQP